jgi:hypothetical protein
MAGLRRVHEAYTWRSVAERMCAVYTKASWRTVTPVASNDVLTNPQWEEG